MIRTAPLLAPIILLAACGQDRVNPPTEPADPITGPMAEPVPTADAAVRPGTGPASFVGRWAANADWCANTTGAERPIEITPTRFEGYENSCLIQEVTEAGDGWTAVLICEAEGQMRRERIQVAVRDTVMDLTYADRGGANVKLARCPAPEPAPKP